MQLLLQQFNATYGASSIYYVYIPILAIILVWLIHTVYDILHFLLNILIGSVILMWFIVSGLYKFIINCWWYVAYSANSIVLYIWARVRLPIDFAAHVSKHFGLLSLSITHLALQILYYVFLLWIFMYLLMLLFHFITH